MPTLHDQLTSTGDVIAGAITGVLSRFCIAPLDVVKIKLQVPYGVTKTYAYKSTFTLMKDIYLKEGFTYLWNGNLAAEYLWCVYSAVQFTTVNYFKKLQLFHSSSYNTFLGGSMSALCSTLVSYPFDLARTRMAAQSAHRTYNHVYKLLFSVYRESNIRGLYSGILPTLIQICPYSGINFTLYEYFVTHWKISSPISGSLYGFMSGTIAKICVYPLDTIKKHFQIRTMFKETQDKSCLQLIKYMYIKNGLKAFYAGIIPSLLKSGISTSLCFGIYEYLYSFLVNHNLYCR
ncbi:hypothetical protein WA158_002326 [Blastocystis sp. Blastoise]